jgi:hypothetical protein
MGTEAGTTATVGGAQGRLQMIGKDGVRETLLVFVMTVVSPVVYSMRGGAHVLLMCVSMRNVDLDGGLVIRFIVRFVVVRLIVNTIDSQNMRPNRG